MTPLVISIAILLVGAALLLLNSKSAKSREDRIREAKSREEMADDPT